LNTRARSSEEEIREDMARLAEGVQRRERVHLEAIFFGAFGRL